MPRVTSAAWRPLCRHGWMAIRTSGGRCRFDIVDLNAQAEAVDWTCRPRSSASDGASVAPEVEALYRVSVAPVRTVEPENASGPVCRDQFETRSAFAIVPKVLIGVAVDERGGGTPWVKLVVVAWAELHGENEDGRQGGTPAQQRWVNRGSARGVGRCGARRVGRRPVAHLVFSTIEGHSLSRIRVLSESADSRGRRPP